MASKRTPQSTITVDMLTILARAGYSGVTLSAIVDNTGYSKSRVRTVLKELKGISLARQYRGKWFIETSSFSYEALADAFRDCEKEVSKRFGGFACPSCHEQQERSKYGVMYCVNDNCVYGKG